MVDRLKEINDQYAKIFQRFLAGGILFLGALSGVFLINIYLPPSEKQEWIAASLLVVAALGGLIALIHYFWLIIIRFKHFLERK